MTNDAVYIIDYDRIKNVEDIVSVLKALNLHIFNPERSTELSFLLENGFLIPAPEKEDEAGGYFNENYN